MNIVEQHMLIKQWELDNAEGWLMMMHGNYFNVIRRAAQMKYKQDLKAGRPDNFINDLYHYGSIEKKKHPAGREREGIYRGYTNYKLIKCDTCTNSYNGAAFTKCPVCAADELLKK